MPSAASRACVVLPTPQIRPTGFEARKVVASASPITEKPRGFSRSEAILARNLLKERPIETVMPISVSMRLCRRASAKAGGPWCRRSVPAMSMNASSIDNGSTSGVSDCISVRTSRPTRLYFSKSGRITTASGQASSALNMGMAERTPRMRAM